MKVELSRLGTIFACALYDELKDALFENVYVDNGAEVMNYDDVLDTIQKVLGVED